MNALFRWESFLAQCGIALDLLIKMQGMRHEPQAKNPVLLEERVAALYIQSKHVAGMIASDKKKQMPPGGTVPIWMENEGLHAVECSVAWTEAADFLDQLSMIASALVDPQTVREKLHELAKPS